MVRTKAKKLNEILDFTVPAFPCMLKRNNVVNAHPLFTCVSGGEERGGEGKGWGAGQGMTGQGWAGQVGGRN